MATVTITSIVGRGGNPPTSVLVEGTSDGCACVNVRVECGSFVNSEVVQPVGGQWSVEIRVQECRCRGPIVVTAQCDSNCNGDIVDQDVWKGELICEGGCPSVALSVSVGDCDANRFRPVEYAVQFAPPLPVGTTGNISIGYGTTNSTSQAFGLLAINVTTTPLSSVTHQTSLPPSVQPHHSTVTVALQVPGAGQCFVVDAIDVTVPSCLPCPDQNEPVTIDVNEPSDPSWCAPVTSSAQAVFTASVNWPTAVSNPPSPSSFAWTLKAPGGAMATQSSSGNVVTTASGWTGAAALGPGGPIDLTQAGIYQVAVTAVFPPSAGLPVLADGTLACILNGLEAFELEACNKIPPDETTDDEGWGWCFALRLLAMMFFATALAALLLSLCAATIAPPLVQPLQYVALVAGALAVALLAVWLALPCERPCQWGLLLAAQVSIAVGWIAIYFGFCCYPWLLVTGIALVAAGLTMLVAWWVRCDLGICRLARELAYPIVAAVGPIIAAILAVPGAYACTNSWITGALAVMAAGISIAAIRCTGK